jgi:plasmid stabilization system protein ParE
LRLVPGAARGARAAFVQRLEACIAKFERNPEIAPVVDEETLRAQLRRFPYVAYYELLDDDILVLAVWHSRRDPKGWKEREE